jgi:hypothetical protein
VHSSFTAVEHANFVAAKVVSHATAFLDGRNDAGELGRNARSVMCELIPVTDDASAKAILDPARLLTIAMMNTAAAEGDARQDRWQHVMGALVELVRHESHELRRAGVQRS